MPLTQPERDNPLMRRYFREINLSNKRLARRCGVSHSQIYMARTRNVGPDNAEKISRGVANILALSEEDRLLLKAEIMGYPGNLLRAWLGSVLDVARLLDVPEPTAAEILDPEKTITHKSGKRALQALREMKAPDPVIESVDRRLMPPPERRRGVITHDLHGPELSARLRTTKRVLPQIKPNTFEAIRASGMTKKKIYESAGVGKETFRQALYGRVGERSARAIAGVLGEAAGLSEGDLRNAQSVVAVAVADDGTVPTGTYTQENRLEEGTNTFTPSPDVTVEVAGNVDAYTITGTHASYPDINVAYDSATGVTEEAEPTP